MKNLPVIILVLVLIGGGIWYYQSTTTEVEQITPGSAGGPTLELVERVKRISIDTAFFSDQQFLALSETPELDISSLVTGRPNPFLSLKKSFGGTPVKR